MERTFVLQLKSEDGRTLVGEKRVGPTRNSSASVPFGNLGVNTEYSYQALVAVDGKRSHWQDGTVTTLTPEVIYCTAFF